MHVDWDLAVPMRDGTVLRADAYYPSAGAGSYPVLLQRTPYDKRLTGLHYLNVPRAVDRGYAVVVQDVRGRFASEGQFEPFQQEIADGYDTVEWCATQSWSAGSVGMYGGSYVGTVQWLAAVADPPHLTCIAPAFAASDHYEGWIYQGGALQTAFITSWLLPFLTPEDARRKADPRALDALNEELADLVDALGNTCELFDLTGELPVAAEYSQYLRDWLEHPTRDAYWRRVSIEDRYGDVHVPSFNIGSWYDIWIDGTIRNFVGMRGQAATAEAREGSRLLVGPWIHDGASSSVAGSYDFGIRSARHSAPFGFDLDGEVLDFFDQWLDPADGNGANGSAHDGGVSLFVMGEDAWRVEAPWPLPPDEHSTYYLHSNGSGDSVGRALTLTEVAPGDEPPDGYVYDPQDPVPTVGGQLCCYWSQLPAGPFDQSAVESRPDVLVYTTDPFESAVEVTGSITLNLWARTSAADTDFTAKLVDVAPDGSASNLTDGILRARFRHGTAESDAITPGEVHEYRIKLGWTCNVFSPGHRIGLEISSSNFPRFGRNPNTGNDAGAKEDMVSANQAIYHDALRPSHLVLAVRPPGGGNG